jgi:hypothetical protein
MQNLPESKLSQKLNYKNFHPKIAQTQKKPQQKNPNKDYVSQAVAEMK